jgi:valyl-tRNA synthetase
MTYKCDGLEIIHRYGSCVTLSLYIGSYMVEALQAPVESLAFFMPLMVYGTLAGAEWFIHRQNQLMLQAFVTKKEKIDTKQAFQVIEWLYQIIDKITTSMDGLDSLSPTERMQLALV